MVRCETCKHWKEPTHGNTFGTCRFPLPFWIPLEDGQRWTVGRNLRECLAHDPKENSNE